MTNSKKSAVFEVEEISTSSYVDRRKIKMRDLLNAKYTKIVVIIIVVIIESMFLLDFNSIRNVFQDNIIVFLRTIFLNKTGEFQWLGVTSIVAIFTLLFTSINTIKKNKADLVAKSRIEWIQEVKKIMSTYLRDVHYYPFIFENQRNCELELKDKHGALNVLKNFSDILSYNESLPMKKKKKIKLEIKKLENENEIKKLEIEIEKLDISLTKLTIEVNELGSKIEESQYLLYLNFSENEDNREINQCITDCAHWIKNMPVRWDANRAEFKYNEVPVTNLLRVSRDYFKREWNKSKRGK